MYVSFRQFLALALLPLVGMMACDVPVPTGGSSGGPTELPDLSAATVRTGSLTESDGTRSNGTKADEVAKVVVAPGATLHVLMESTAFDTFLEVRVEGSEQTFTNDDWQGSRQRSFVSQRNATGAPLSAVIVASAYGASGRGDYTVRYLVEAPPVPPAARRLSLPAAVSGTLGASSPEVALLSNDATRRADAYEFTLASGQSATIRMESSSFDPYLKVLRNGQFSARNDDFGGSRSVSQVEVSGAGSYTVLAGAFSAINNTGGYTLAVTAARQNTPVPNASGDGSTVQGTISDSDTRVALTASDALRLADAYSVSLQAGQTLIATMESSAFDTYLKLMRGGEFVARNDDAGSTSRSEIRHVASASGTYTLYAGTFMDSGRGSYTLSWRVE
ncbi:MAG TPA: hypothetical protein EYQ24_00660 [Bacteroidetes bacterium]|nr:hypothetical protein [Bacteroidota bacterium]HIL56731.1 hypothetical protein [Rhodothermales bacterium]